MMELWITLPEDFLEKLENFRRSLSDAGALPATGALSWDKNSAVMSLGSRLLQIPPTTNQSVLCDALFDIPLGEWLEDIAIHHSYYSESETSMYDAVRAVNKAVREGFGFDELLQFKKLRARIRTEILNQNHSD